MNFNSHSEVEGKHAFLSPSYYHWLNYDDQKLEARFYGALGAQRGTDLHKLAHDAIRLGVKLAKSMQAIGLYVQDAIGFKMACEQTLYYSENCFGTADTISFRHNKLRIHDLKTGINPTKETQLEVYAAIFCLEYGFSPFDIEIELRIYQRDEVRVFEPEPAWINSIMEKIVEFDQRVQVIREEARW